MKPLKTILSVLLAGVLLLMPLTSLAEIKTTATLLNSYNSYSDPDFYTAGSLVSVKINEGYGLINENNELVTEEPYRGFLMSMHNPNYFCAYANAGGGYNILNHEGKSISSKVYQDTQMWDESNSWVAGITIEEANAEPYDYTGHQRIKEVDIYYQGKFVRTVSRAEWKLGFQPYGDYLYLSNSIIIGNNGSSTIKGPSTCYYSPYSEYSWDSEQQAYWHWGSGQYAFTPGCTLTNEEVAGYILYDGHGNFLDLQGNITFSHPQIKEFGTKVLTPYCGKYIIFGARSNNQNIYYMFDLQGNIIVEGSEIADVYNNSNGIMASGYQLYVDHDGYLHYTDANGNACAEFTLHSSAATAKSVNYNLPFIFYQNMETGKYTIISAEAGKLNAEFDQIDAYNNFSFAPGARILGVVLDGKYGVIDMYGNTVIPFKYDGIQMNDDGTMVVMKIAAEKKYDIYRIDYNELIDEPTSTTESTEAQTPEVWICNDCNRENDMNFCPGCGAAQPVNVICVSCGFEQPDPSYLFCPNCGNRF